MSGQIVAVTGCAGFVATEIVKQLLEKGYHVKGTVRSLAHTDKYAHLKKLASSTKGKLELFEADVLKPESFSVAFQGAVCVFHTASPFIFKVADAQRDLINPALNGTRNVLEAVRSSPTVKVVIVTSSIAAIIDPVFGDYSQVHTEADWNEGASLRVQPYMYSKTVAERAVWQWATENPTIRVATINPGFVLGPVYGPRADGESVSQIKKMLDGTYAKKGMLGFSHPVADSRNVARAHIAAFENPRARGRYIVSSAEGVPFSKMVEWLKEAGFGNYPLPSTVIGPTVIPRVSYEKAASDLGYTPRPPRDTVVDMAHALVKVGLVSDNVIKSKL